MAENEWSVALAAVMKALAKAGVNQMIVTRERTVYGWPIASMIKVASALSRPSETNNTWSCSVFNSGAHITRLMRVLVDYSFVKHVMKELSD